MSREGSLYWRTRKTPVFLLILALIFSMIPISAAAEPGGVIDPQESYVTVRIEGNGYGTDGEKDGIEEVIGATAVKFSELGDEPTALDAVNYALRDNGIEEEVRPGFASEIGGVSAMEGSGAWWTFMHNDEGASDSLDQTSISAGDTIVLRLVVFEPEAKPDYQYFKIVSSSTDIQWGFAYGEVTLALYNKKDMGWGSDGTIWDITPVGDVPIFSNGVQAWTPEGGEASTNNANGLATIALYSNETVTGAYSFDITGGKAGATKAYCRVTMTFDGTNPPTITFSQPTMADTTLKAVNLSFNGEGNTNGLPYVNGGGMTVNYAVTGVKISAAVRDDEAVLTAEYKGAEDDDYSEYDLETPVDAALAVGENTFKFTVDNGGDTQTHTLIIIREGESVRDIAAEVSAVINGVKTVTWYQPANDWVLAMNGAGLTVPEADKKTYLEAVLTGINAFADNGTGNVGTMAKTAMALTTLGIDARQIPDPDGGDAPIDLVGLISDYSGDINIYSAPYVLSLYDLKNSSGSQVYSIPQNPALTREELIGEILSAQNEETGLFGSIDDTGMVLPALAPYYLTEETTLNGIDAAVVKTAVGAAITALSEAQAIDGGFGGRNSNTTSTVLIGLAALEINPHTDIRFIKSGSTVITDLLSFRTGDGKLGFTNNTSADDMASVQGFQALAVYRNLTGAGSGNLYHFTANVSAYTNWPEAKLLTGISVTSPVKTSYALNEGGGTANIDTEGMVVTAYYNANAADTKIITEGYTVSTIDTSASGTQKVTVTYQGHTATFNVTVKGEGGADPIKKTVKIIIRSSGKGTIATDSAYVIQPGATSVMDVLKAVLSEAGKTYVIQGGAYVAEIDGLGEFSGGPNSGWLYYIDGTDTVTAAKDYKLEGGEEIEWIYTLDYTKEKGAEKWGGAPLPEKSKGTITKETLNSVIKEIKSGSRDSWTINLAQGSIIFDQAALSGLIDRMKGDSVDVIIEPAQAKDLSAKQRESAGDRPVYNISITSGGENLSSLRGKFTISILYGLKEGESSSGIVIYYLDDLGALVPVEGVYDQAGGKAMFTVDHLSYYVIGYDKTLLKWPFADVAQDDGINWFYSPVKYVYEHGIFNGTSTTTFSPNSSLTRSMLVSALARLSKADLTVYEEMSFTDVNLNSWYGPSVAWAKEMGIVSGYANKDGSFSFKPDDKIRRQDIAVIINNYNEKIAKKNGDQIAASTFTDHDQIAEYARDAVYAMQQLGIIKGSKNKDGSFRFQPVSNATRAEAAMMIYNMISEI